MKSLDNIYRVHRLLKAARHPVPFGRLQEELGDASPSTVKRLLRDMKGQLGAPIATSRDPPGYRYTDLAWELPGLWFGADELHALLTLQHLLRSFQPGLLDEALTPLRVRLANILKVQGLSEGALDRVRLISGPARPAGKHFGEVAQAVLRRKKLLLQHRAKERDEILVRTVSPQRLVNYCGTWYVDAWCERANGLRTFGLDGIEHADMQDLPALDVTTDQIASELDSSYGIFAGQPTAMALLRFTATRARWLKDAIWHSQQLSRVLDDGSLELEIPFRRSEELILDILKYGPDVEVMAPDSLRTAVAERLLRASSQYGDRG